MHSKEQPVYPMRVARDLTGLTERQIRYYDTLGLVSPFRTEGGHRLYSQHDIEKLATVARLMSRGVGIDEIRNRLRTLDEKPHRSSDLGDAYFRTMRPQPYGSVSQPHALMSPDREPRSIQRPTRQGEWKPK